MASSDGTSSSSLPTTITTTSPPSITSPPLSSPSSTSPSAHKHTLSPTATPLSPIASPTDAALPASYPLAAQIPISSFAPGLPTFPPEAAHLRALTLTADIKFQDYQGLLHGGEWELPHPPQSVTHLTLELFSLGFPGRNPKWLSNLARALPNLKSVTFFSCLIDGLDDASRADAVAFFDLARVCREVHVIDCFVRPGFWADVGRLWGERAREAKMEAEADKAGNGAGAPEEGEDPTQGMGDGGVKVVEISYTYRGHEDSDFLARCHGEELAGLLVPGLVGFGCGLVEEAEGDKELGDGKEEKSGIVGGVLPYASDSRATRATVERFGKFEADPGALAGLKVLNLALWTLTVKDVKEILGRIRSSVDGGGDNHTGLIDLTLSILMTDGWVQSLAEALKESQAAVRGLEGIEIVGVPSIAKPKGTASGPGKTDEQIDNIMDKGDQAWDGSGAKDGVRLLTQEEAKVLGDACPRLAKVEMSILKARKAGVATFVREGPGEGWKAATA